MGWLFREIRGEKQGWTERTLASISAPPLPLLAIVGIVVVLLSISSYTSFKMQMQRSIIGFKLFLFFLPLVLIFVAHSITRYGRFVVISPRTKEVSSSQSGGSPWAVAMLVVVLLLMIFYQPYFHSKWWPPIWGPY
ncbi:hypothetical protein FEM48_Zijuj06G0018800 [Ziziphus jujuba var. spinosa]|uniref:Transmembrane protein n=1 Tax=Ziziphus jujuba var. spinosa TaxID=714518 RepID=A0A978V6H2_ZIZJJ|nr:hypothetical protein FEM48_Zijuj06G0018800 [Ziziphus jujuba var. spinosa]